MRPRRTHSSNKVFRLGAGNEDNDLWVQLGEIDGEVVIASTWEPSEDERREIAEGANVQLIVWGAGHPPVAIATTGEALGKAPDAAAR